jgi:hypothetical protein
MSALEGDLADYLAVRRGLGFKLDNEQRMLANFVAFIESVGASTITVELAAVDHDAHRSPVFIARVSCAPPRLRAA